MASVTSEFFAFPGIIQVTVDMKVTVTTKLAMLVKVLWRFPTQSLQRIEARIGNLVKCLLLFDLNQFWNVSTNF